MKTNTIKCAFVTFILSFPLVGFAVEHKIALVIGNSNYVSTDPLPNPVRDANAMSDALRDLGFKVHRHLDLKRREMRHALREFKRDLRPGSIAVVYYAGHGIQVGRENYLLPVDTDIREEYEVPDEGLGQSGVLRALKAADISLGIVMLDACRNNPFERALRGVTRSTGEGQGLAAVDAVRGTLLSYATQPGNVAVDGAGKHSPYTEALLKYMMQPGLNVQDMFNRVGHSVLKSTQFQQEPWLSVSPIPNFCFAGCENPFRVSALDGIEAQKQLSRFQRLFAAGNLSGLSEIASLTREQKKQLQFIFGRYSKLEVGLSDMQVDEAVGKVTATIEIAEAVDDSGHRIVPAEAWRRFPVGLNKSPDGWSKISWY